MLIYICGVCFLMYQCYTRTNIFLLIERGTSNSVRFTYRYCRFFRLANTPSDRNVIAFDFRLLWKGIIELLLKETRRNLPVASPVGALLESLPCFVPLTGPTSDWQVRLALNQLDFLSFLKWRIESNERRRLHLHFHYWILRKVVMY